MPNAGPSNVPKTAQIIDFIIITQLSRRMGAAGTQPASLAMFPSCRPSPLNLRIDNSKTIS